MGIDDSKGMNVYLRFIKRNLILAVLACLSIGRVSTVEAAGLCHHLFERLKAAKVVSPGAFLHQQNSRLHTTQNVERVASKNQTETGQRLIRPADKIMHWLNYMETSYQQAQENPAALNQIKKHYLDQHVTKIDEIPESFFEFQLKVSHEEGNFALKMTPEMKKRWADIAVSDQKQSLSTWLDFLLSTEADVYPMWVKYWSFNSLVKLGKFDSRTGTFGSRSSGRMMPFAELDREAYAYVIDAMIKKVNGNSLESIQDPASLNSLSSENFGKLYGQALKGLMNKRMEHLNSTEGEWVLYKRGSDARPLVQSLEGKNTGWCTAGHATAEAQLAKGDLHVFYSKDDQGKFTVPRVAIRLTGSVINEVRGIIGGKAQEIDQYIHESSVIQDKMKEFGERGEFYAKRPEHMQKLSEIEQTVKKGEELNGGQLRFLHEIDEAIAGFGYEKNGRVQNLLQGRNLRSDLAKIFKTSPEKIALSQKEVVSGVTEYYHGSLNLKATTAGKGKTYAFPKRMRGSLELPLLVDATGITFPEWVGGDLNLESLPQGLGVVLPKYVGGTSYLNKTKTTEK